MTKLNEFFERKAELVREMDIIKIKLNDPDLDEVSNLALLAQLYILEVEYYGDFD